MSLKLYELYPTSAGAEGMPLYDVALRFIVFAYSQDEARAIAQERGGDECYTDARENISFWTNSAKTTCVELTTGLTSGVVIRDFRSG